MKKVLKLFFVILVSSILISLESCGPVIISSRPAHPTPNWFYPNRVVNLRYVYFPDHLIYYDLSLRNYVYFDNGIWLTVNVLPSKFNSIDFKRAKRVRVNNYYGDNIRDYHNNNNNRVNEKGRRTHRENESTSRRR